MADSLFIPTIAKRRSLISRAIAFIAIVAVSLTSLVAWDGWQARQSELQQAELLTANMARAMTQHAEAAIGSTDNILAGLVERIENVGMSNIQPAALKPFMMRRVAEQEIVSGLIVIDETARPIINSHPNPPAGISYGDRDYFEHHRDYADRGPYVGPAVLSKTTQTWIITLSRRLEHPDGSFAGVMLATISLDFFQRFYEEFDIGQSGAIFWRPTKELYLLGGLSWNRLLALVFPKGRYLTSIEAEVQSARQCLCRASTIPNACIATVMAQSILSWLLSQCQRPIFMLSGVLKQSGLPQSAPS